mmetsp:Transcript_47421/g.76410  ORF Transcript_47421/g.76410 Transcript_47421/m.76410 type:complete len:110 (+) Transcript_47421:111-440(+)
MGQMGVNRDMEKLCALAPELKELQLCPNKIVDLQIVALDSWRQLGGRSRRHDTPSLKKLCEMTLNLTLDKTQQCSDWDQRPVSAAQLEYAALDARVLDAFLLPHFIHLV